MRWKKNIIFFFYTCVNFNFIYFNFDGEIKSDNALSWLWHSNKTYLRHYINDKNAVVNLLRSPGTRLPIHTDVQLASGHKKRFGAVSNVSTGFREPKRYVNRTFFAHVCFVFVVNIILCNNIACVHLKVHTYTVIRRGELDGLGTFERFFCFHRKISV